MVVAAPAVPCFEVVATVEVCGGGVSINVMVDVITVTELLIVLVRVISAVVWAPPVT